MVRHVVKRIRKSYRKDVPIRIRMDAGFFDEKLFKVYEDLRIAYVCAGRIYEDVRAFVAETERRHWKRIVKGKKAWEVLEFGSRRGSWDGFRKAVFCRPMERNGQLVFFFVRA